MAVIDVRGIVLAFCEEAAELIERYFGEPLVADIRLPPRLDRFVTHQRRIVEDRRDLREAPAANELPGGRTRLSIRLISAADDGDDGGVLLLEERADRLAVDRAAQAGLTDRQIEVSRLIVEGHATLARRGS